MKVIIAGSRTLCKQEWVETAVSRAFNNWMAKDQDNWEYYIRPEIVSGGAAGVDFCAELYAKKHSLPFKEFPAKWEEYGKKAGYLRNKEMGIYADALVAVWDGKSKGTLHMINVMADLNKLIYVYCP
jgi:hypothetical protein